jgi:hypothetical protein
VPREVPERPLPRDRLVDAARGDAVQRDAGVEGGVAGVAEPATHLDLAEPQQLQDGRLVGQAVAEARRHGR